MQTHGFYIGMYIRTIKRKNKDGTEVEYIQLAHNTRHPEKGYSKAEIIYSFGRRDQLDVPALKRLISSISRFISPEDAQTLEAPSTGLKFVSSQPAGGALLLKGLWQRIGVDKCLTKVLKGRDFTAPIGDAIFAMVADRALAASSTLTIEELAAKDVHPDIGHPIQVQHCYQGMDFLLEHEVAIQEKVFRATAHLLNLNVDLIFFDTINTYFEMDDPKDSDLLAYGKSKHKKDDLPQVTMGLAVTKVGIPVRCWVLPGKHSDAKCIDQVRKELNDWKLGKSIWVTDRGMTGDNSLSPEDIALGYKQFMEVEKAFHILKTNLSLSPVFHTKPERIRAHVILCWLTLLLVRVAELETGMTWTRIRAELERLHLGEFHHKDGCVLQYTEPTKLQDNILKQLNISLPEKVRYIKFTP